MAEATTVELQMPQMGESVTEGVILEWHKSEGDFVEEGETVVEVSTDKIDAEVPAPASGVVAKILAQPDETVQVGQTLAEIDPSGEPTEGGSGGEESADPADATVVSEAPPPPAAETPQAEGQTVQVVMPEMGESVTEGTVLEFHV